MLGLHQAVEEDDEAGRRAGKAAATAPGSAGTGRPSARTASGTCSGDALALQPVADQAVERGQRPRAAGMRRERIGVSLRAAAQQRLRPDSQRPARGPQACVDAVADPVMDDPDGAPCGPTARNTRWEMPL